MQQWKWKIKTLAFSQWKVYICNLRAYRQNFKIPENNDFSFITLSWLVVTLMKEFEVGQYGPT